MDEVEQRRRALQTFIDANDIKVGRWAKDAGLTSDGGLRDFLSGRNDGMNISTYVALAEAKGVSVDKLLRVHASNDEASHSVVRRDKKGEVELFVIERTEYVQIGRYDARLSAGPGSIVEANPEPVGFEIFERQWLRAITAAAPSALAVLQVDGDSMTSTLNDRDWVLVDRTQTKFAREGIYALQVLGETWVKRLTVDLQEKLVRIISDNPIYPEQKVRERDVTIIGRVIWVVGRRL